MNVVDRQERTQRIRYGLTGLAVVFLFVLLGTAISRSVSESDQPPAPNMVETDKPNEPLAEIGAAPAPDSNGSATANSPASQPKP